MCFLSDPGHDVCLVLLEASRVWSLGALGTYLLMALISTLVSSLLLAAFKVKIVTVHWTWNTQSTVVIYISKLMKDFTPLYWFVLGIPLLKRFCWWNALSPEPYQCYCKMEYVCLLWSIHFYKQDTIHSDSYVKIMWSTVRHVIEWCITDLYHILFYLLHSCIQRYQPYKVNVVRM